MSYQKDIFNLIARVAGQDNILAVPRLFCEITGSLEAGMLLSQIIYFADKGKDPDGWFYKSYIEWEEHLFLSEYQVRKNVKAFETIGFLETKLKKVSGTPVLHYRIDRASFSTWVLEILSIQIRDSHVLKPKNLGVETKKFADGCQKKSTILYTETTLPETTTKTTTDLVNKPVSIKNQPSIPSTIPNAAARAESNQDQENGNGWNGVSLISSLPMEEIKSETKPEPTADTDPSDSSQSKGAQPLPNAPLQSCAKGSPAMPPACYEEPDPGPDEATDAAAPACAGVGPLPPRELAQSLITTYLPEWHNPAMHVDSRDPADLSHLLTWLWMVKRIEETKRAGAHSRDGYYGAQDIAVYEKRLERIVDKCGYIVTRTGGGLKPAALRIHEPAPLLPTDLADLHAAISP